MISTHEELRKASAAFLAQYLAQRGSARAEEGRGNGVVAIDTTVVNSAVQLPFESRSGGTPPLPTAAKVATFEAVIDKASFNEHEHSQQSSGAGWLRQFRCAGVRCCTVNIRICWECVEQANGATHTTYKHTCNLQGSDVARTAGCDAQPHRCGRAHAHLRVHLLPAGCVPWGHA